VIRLEPSVCPPWLAAPHSNLGIAPRELGKLEEAIAVYRATIRIEPDRAEPHGSLVLTLAGQEKLHQAIAELRKARENAQPGSELVLLIGHAQTELGD
jgi:tetratricopeptide (TPR) repeat protein